MMTTDHLPTPEALDRPGRGEPYPAAQIVARLLDRASSYARDGSVLRREGETDAAVVYETVAAELRQVAAEVTR